MLKVGRKGEHFYNFCFFPFGTVVVARLSYFASFVKIKKSAFGWIA